MRELGRLLTPGGRHRLFVGRLRRPRWRRRRPSRRKLAAAVGGGLLAGATLAHALWWRRNPSACPYNQRVWVELPHPLITRRRLLEILKPAPGERILELGPGAGYYSPAVAERLGGGRLELFDLQQEMLDHTMRRAERLGQRNLVPTQGDATALPYEDESLDAAVLVTVLGEIPDQDAALRELARVLRPAGRLVTGELLIDPHYVSLRSLRERASRVGLELEERVGGALGYFARLRKPAPG